jgi:hypothetical protein
LCVDNIVRMNVAVRRIIRASSFHVLTLQKILLYEYCELTRKLHIVSERF